MVEFRTSDERVKGKLSAVDFYTEPLRVLAHREELKNPVARWSSDQELIEDWN